MGAKKIIDFEDATKVVLSKLSNEEKDKVHKWATTSLHIVKDDSLSKRDKIKKLTKLNPPKQIAPLIKSLLLVMKDKVWTDQSWARRGMAVGLGLGAAVFGSQAAGLASAGFGVGVPLALLTTVGATFLGVLVDEIEKERKK
ncbi:MAG: hypothetical protein IPJ71_10590 [Bdellovibrionales bacterium]|nr:hypothetical protein [Bdellovibrionales bacterium]